MNKRVVISGCSGGGKSTLLTELERRGFPVVEEPGRRVVQDQLRNHGTALPWINLQAFLERVIDVALDDIASVNASNQWVFFDRGLVDAVIGLQYLAGESVRKTPDLMRHYHGQVFLAPPWPQIYVQDNERRHNLDTATAEYSRLLEAYPLLGYSVTILPKTGVAQRADFILRTLGA